MVLTTGYADTDASGDETIDALLLKPISLVKFRATMVAIIYRKWVRWLNTLRRRY